MEKLIIIEGPQGAGKTTVSDYIRKTLPYTNLYRLSGTNDNSPSGYYKSKRMYNNLLKYLKSLENKGLNLVFDRTFFTEYIYCKLGLKEYSFDKAFNKLLDKFSKLKFDIYYVTLCLDDYREYEKRLSNKDRKGKAIVKYANFNKESSIKQQEEYDKLFLQIRKEYKNIKCIKLCTNIPRETLYNKINNEILNIK